MCICMRAGAQLWVERDRVANLQPLLQQSTGHIFVSFGNQTINTADIVGIFGAEAIGELTMRKNGKWRCGFSEWHKRGDDCNRPDQRLEDVYGERRKLIKACQVCLGEGRKGLMGVEGKKVCDRCNRNVPITTQIAEWEQRYALCRGFYRDEFE
jgi:hypothetical protein